jgi:hypothetical protein
MCGTGHDTFSTWRQPVVTANWRMDGDLQISIPTLLQQNEKRRSRRIGAGPPKLQSARTPSRAGSRLSRSLMCSTWNKIVART